MTSLSEAVGEEVPEPVPQTIGDDQHCHACSRELGCGHAILLPGSGRTFHQTCLVCAQCKKGFGEVGRKTFVEQRGRVYHHEVSERPNFAALGPELQLMIRYLQCCPSGVLQGSVIQPPLSPVHASLRASTSRVSLPLPLSPSQPKVVPIASFESSIKSSPTSIFATRSRPPANLGGLLVCAGCSVRATERETVLGPLGKRYHAKCLKCNVCSRLLDSECRVGKSGELRCEACRVSPGNEMETPLVPRR